MQQPSRETSILSFALYLAATLLVLCAVPVLALCELAWGLPKARIKASSY